ncbi:MAG: hypothetical protein IAG10_15020 [Planctomycetaceae bacterium]|nr:hypothetical protein [Planctomycetaceae bacterium]
MLIGRSSSALANRRPNHRMEISVEYSNARRKSAFQVFRLVIGSQSLASSGSAIRIAPSADDSNHV